MGAFIIMACDYRLGARGKYKFTLPETAIGMDLPPILVALTASRIAPAHMTRAAIQSEVYNPDQAATAGFIDEVVEPEELDATAMATAQRLARLPGQYATNKLAVRAQTLQVMQDSLDQFGGP